MSYVTFTTPCVDVSGEKAGANGYIKDYMERGRHSSDLEKSDDKTSQHSRTWLRDRHGRECKAALGPKPNCAPIRIKSALGGRADFGQRPALLS